MSLKELIKKLLPKPKFQDFIVDFDTIKKKPICYGDLFKQLGMVDLVQKILVDGKYHYANIRANSLTINILDTILKENLLKTKNRYSKMYRPKALESMSAFDRLMYAPKADESVPKNTIRVLLPNHKEYTAPIYN